VDSGLAFQYTLCGDFRRAGELIEECVEPVRRLRLTNMVLYTTATRAAIAAHQGRRGDMERDLAEFRSRGGESTPYAAMAAGLCEAICALLEEDRAGAGEALTRAAGYERDNPTIFHLSGRHGLQLLLRALDGDLTLPGYVTAAGTMSAALRWNRQFGLLAHAVLLGRAGDAEAARDAVARAGAEAEIFPMARWLGARLVAEAAIADGWADPVPWLRAAEDYFHRCEVPAVASACRSLLRRSGARVTQRRSGHERVPAALRRRGMTIREYEVLELLVDRPGNREIAARLHLSPRTVEKHVANLLAKAGLPDRAALCAYAARAVPRS
jgi:DNA-binding CsgD family transcriptional regulator